MSEVLKISTTEGMTKIQSHVLVKPDSPILRAVAPVFDFNNAPRSPKEIANILIEKMTEYGGIGLSACQIGMTHRAFVMGVGEEVVTFFNPEIIDASKHTDYELEGCLSFPNFYVGVNRPLWVRVKYDSYDGVSVEKSFSGLTARCFHHELDHLNGVIFSDRAGKLALKLAKKRQEKIEKKQVYQIQNLMNQKNNQTKKSVGISPLLAGLMSRANANITQAA